MQAQQQRPVQAHARVVPAHLGRNNLLPEDLCPASTNDGLMPDDYITVGLFGGTTLGTMGYGKEHPHHFRGRRRADPRLLCLDQGPSVAVFSSCAQLGVPNQAFLSYPRS